MVTKKNQLINRTNYFGFLIKLFANFPLTEEDKFIHHSRAVTKHFLAEGIVQANPIMIASMDRDPEAIVRSLPEPAEDTKDYPPNLSPGSDDMRIAWRYNALPQYVSSTGNQKRYFDLSKRINPTTIANHDCTYWTGREPHDIVAAAVNTTTPFRNHRFASLLNGIAAKLKAGQFSRRNPQFANENCLRIAILSIGSPVWYSADESGGYEADLLRFFTILKALVKNTTAVCLVTIPAHLIATSAQMVARHLLDKIENLVDYVVELNSICSYEEIKNVYKDYNGIFNIKKLASVNALAHNYIGSYDLAYVLSSRRFTIETIHLPPDISEQADEMGGGGGGQVDMSCGSSTKHLLEF